MLLFNNDPSCVPVFYRLSLFVLPGFFPGEALLRATGSSADLPVTSQNRHDCRCMHKRPALARECQLGHACVHAVPCSLPSTDSHWTPLQKAHVA